MYCNTCDILDRIAMMQSIAAGVAWAAWFVCASVWVSVGHACELCKNGWADRVAVCDVDSGGPKNPGIRRGPGPHGKEHFYEHRQGTKVCRKL